MAGEKNSSWLDWNCPYVLIHVLILNHRLVEPPLVTWSNSRSHFDSSLIFVGVLLLVLIASNTEPGFR